MKKCVIIISSIVLLLGVLLIGVIYNNKKNAEIQEQYAEYLFKNKSEFLQNLCIKNGNWKNYPLSKEFLFKYNEKDGIFGDMQFDKVEVDPYVNTDDNLYLSHYNHIALTKNNKISIYQYKLKTHGTFSKPPYYPLLDDVILSEPIISEIDFNGKFDYKRPMKKSYKSDNIYNLCDGGVYESAIATTNNFKSKYPHFLDLFIHYSPLSFNKIKFIGEESDLDNNIAIFEVDSILECKKRKYRVKLILDDKLYLDDAEVELMEEKGYEGNSQNSSAKAFYTHSNLDKTNLTEEFIEKIKQKGSCFIDIDSVDIDYDIDEKCINNKDYTEYIRTYKMKNGNKYSYYEKYYISNNGEIEDISFEKLDYINMTSEEVVKQYLDK